MYSNIELVILLALASSAVASPVITTESSPRLSLTKSIGGYDAVVNDRLRFRSFIRDTSSADRVRQGAPLVNYGLGYLATIGVGDPPQMFNVLVDTGSSLTWVGGNTTYKPTRTSVKASDLTFSLGYAIGQANVTLYHDQMTLGGLSAFNQSIGVAYESAGFYNIDGILGIGPTDLFPHFRNITDFNFTFTDTLFSQGAINTSCVALSFEPKSSNQSIANGEITFGTIDPSKYTGNIAYASRTKSGMASQYWGMNQSVAYGSKNILSNGAGVVDSGTTFTYLTSDAFKKYKGYSGATLDNNRSLHYITPAQYKSLKSLYFHINGTLFEFSPNAQILPRESEILGAKVPDDRYYLAVNDLASLGNVSLPLDFLLGYTFLERFYTVFDTTNDRIGFATTAYTNSTINL